MSKKIETVKAGSFEMDYFKFGRGEKTMVILPGISVQSVMGLADLVAEAYDIFSEAYTVYLFDRRKEIPATYSVTDMARDTAEALRALGLEEIDLMGASQGGMIAMKIASDNQDLIHKLVVCSSSSRIEATGWPIFEEWINLANEGNAEGLYLSFGEAVYPKDVFEQSKTALANASKTVTKEELERFVIIAEGMKDFDITADLKKISCPVLVLGSMDDEVLGGEASFRIAEQLKDKKGLVLHMYDGYGHAAYDTAPGYKETILRFLLAE